MRIVRITVRAAGFRALNADEVCHRSTSSINNVSGTVTLLARREVIEHEHEQFMQVVTLHNQSVVTLRGEAQLIRIGSSLAQ